MRYGQVSRECNSEIKLNHNSTIRAATVTLSQCIITSMARFTLSFTQHFLCRMLPFIVGNVGMVFTKGDLIDCREILLQNKVKYK